MDFTDLNKFCPNDSFPLPRIDQLVDVTCVVEFHGRLFGDTTKSQCMSLIKNTLLSSQNAGSTVIRSCRSVLRTEERPTNASSI